MISRSAVSEKIRLHELRVGKDFLDALDRIVEFLIEEAVNRAKWNKRKTVREADLAYPIGELGGQESEGGPKIKTELKQEESPLKYNPVIKEVEIGRSGGILRIGPNRGGQ